MLQYGLFMFVWYNMVSIQCHTLQLQGPKSRRLGRAVFVARLAKRSRFVLGIYDDHWWSISFIIILYHLANLANSTPVWAYTDDGPHMSSQFVAITSLYGCYGCAKSQLKMTVNDTCEEPEILSLKSDILSSRAPSADDSKPIPGQHWGGGTRGLCHALARALRRCGFRRRWYLGGIAMASANKGILVILLIGERGSDETRVAQTW